MSERGETPYSEIHKDSFRKAKFPSEGEPGRHIEEAESEEGMRTYDAHGPEEYKEHIEAMQGPEAREAFEMVCSLADAVKEKGGTALLVGGCVRDEVLGVASKDFDVEVYGMTPEQLKEVAESLGKIDEVGKAFGILKLTGESGVDLDLSLPRKDSKVGEGHTGFEVEFDPDMSITEAARRRDFTFNALAKDPLTGKIYDAFGGVEDLKERTLRVTDEERFRDDPLRILRGAQFVGRFGLRTDPDSMKLMQEMVPEMAELSKERIREEWDKLLLKSTRPSMGLQMLFDAGVVKEYYPELANLSDTEQEFEWHPEGDVWVHTLMVTDSAADVVRENHLEGEEARIVMYGALSHDLGKPKVTEFKDGRLKAHGHEPAGEEPTRTLLEKLGTRKNEVDAVVATVREHLWPSMAYFRHIKGEKTNDGAFRKLAKRLAPANIAHLTYVSEADHRGRGPFLDGDHQEQFMLPDPYNAGPWVRERAEEIGVYREAAKPLLQGRDLIRLGFKPGRDFGKIIMLTEQLRDDKEWSREQVMDAIHATDSAEDAIESLEKHLE